MNYDYRKKNAIRNVIFIAIIAVALTIGLGQSTVSWAAAPADIQETARQTPELSDRQINQQTTETIEVRRYIFTGQNLFAHEELAALLKDHLGKEATLSDLEKQADIITKYFRSNGYFLASAYIPPQDFEYGIVKIAIEPGRYDQVIINNKTNIHDDAIIRELGDVKSGEIIRKSGLERALFLIGDLACAEAKTSLQAGSEPGTTTITITVNPKGNHTWGYIGFDNSGYKYTGRYRYSAMIGQANLAKEGDRFVIDASNTTVGGSWSANAAYVLPVFTQGLKLGVSYNKSYYALGEPFNFLDATGTAETTSIYLEKNLKRSRNSNLYAQVRFDSKELSDSVFGDRSNKDVNNWAIGLHGDTLDTWQGGGSNTYSLTYTHGKLSILDPIMKLIDDWTLKTAGNFGKYNLNLSRLQYLNERTNLFMGYSYQYAEKNLDSSEKMALGGPYGVRAYPIGEASGDQGWLGTIELRHNLPRKEGAKNTWQLIAFLDGGTVRLNKDPLPYAHNNSRSLYGAGVGVNWSNTNNFAARLHYAFKLGNEHAQSDTDKSGRLWYQMYKFF